MYCFVVIKHGVYRHAIFGVYDGEEEARKAAERAIKFEPDDYHEYEVVQVEKNKDGWGLMQERGKGKDNVIATIRREGDVLTWTEETIEWLS